MQFPAQPPNGRRSRRTPAFERVCRPHSCRTLARRRVRLRLLLQQVWLPQLCDFGRAVPGLCRRPAGEVPHAGEDQRLCAWQPASGVENTWHWLGNLQQKVGSSGGSTGSGSTSASSMRNLPSQPCQHQASNISCGSPRSSLGDAERGDEVAVHVAPPAHRLQCVFGTGVEGQHSESQGMACKGGGRATSIRRSTTHCSSWAAVTLKSKSMKEALQGRPTL